MTYSRSVLKAAVLAAPLGAMALSAEAADVVGTIKEQPQFSTLAKAIEQAGVAQSLQGGGPYTIFAPTDQAFERLPPGALNELMKEENKDQLETLLQYHVVEGKELSAKDALGKQTEVDTLAGDSLSIDGEGRMVLLVPTGLTVTRVGDQVIVERDVAAVTAPEVEVAPAGQSQEQSGQQARTEVTPQSDMPASEHQQRVLRERPASEQQQTSPQTGIPATPHQEQLLRGDQEGRQQQTGTTGQTQQQSGQQSGQRTQVTQQSDMPASEHQQQVLREQPATEQQQTAPQDTGMPSSPHQEQVLRGEQSGEQQQSGQQQIAGQSAGAQKKGVLREATVIEPDIQADNGVIHAIDAVLVPQSVLSKLESMGQGQQTQGQQGQPQQSKAKQG